MAAAIAAHGGAEQLAHLDNVKITGHGRFKEQVEITGTTSFVAPATWATEARLRGRIAMQFGMDGERCWRRDRQFVRACSAEDEREYRRFGQVLRLRLLHGLAGAPLVPAGMRDLNGTAAPALRLGELVLAFDPQSHRLIEVSGDNWSEVYSDFRTVNGAVVAASRKVMMHGAVDVVDSWDEILPGQADLQMVHPPPAPEDGQTLDESDPERWVATATIEDLDGDLAQVVGSLDEFARAQGRELSASDGIVLTELSAQPGAPAQWEVAIGLEPASPNSPPTTSGSAKRFGYWPEGRFVGVFHRGDPRESAEKRAKVLLQLVDRQALQRVPGSSWQVVCTRESLEQPLAERLCLVRLAVAPAAATR